MLTDVSKAIVLDALASPEVRHELRDFILETLRAAHDLTHEADANDRLIDIKEAAQLLSMTPAGLRQAVHRDVHNKFGVVRLGRRLRFSRAALLALRAR